MCRARIPLQPARRQHRRACVTARQRNQEAKQNSVHKIVNIHVYQQKHQEQQQRQYDPEIAWLHVPGPSTSYAQESIGWKRRRQKKNAPAAASRPRYTRAQEHAVHRSGRYNHVPVTHARQGARKRPSRRRWCATSRTQNGEERGHGQVNRGPRTPKDLVGRIRRRRSAGKETWPPEDVESGHRQHCSFLTPRPCDNLLMEDFFSDL